MSWLQAVERLNRTAATELADAARQCHDLIATARSLAPYTVAPEFDGAAPLQTDGGCPAPRCAFRNVLDGAALCALVRGLDEVEPALPVSHRSIVSVDELVEQFRDALTDALDAVRYCRLTEHPAGRCWFATAATGPGCGEVLRLAHRCA